MILVWLILIPFLGGLLCWQAERWGEQAPRWIALATMLFVLVISVVLWLGGDFSLPGSYEASGCWSGGYRGFPDSASKYTWQWTACH